MLTLAGVLLVSIGVPALIGLGALALLPRIGPVGMAISRKIRGNAADDDELAELRAEVDELRARMPELEERLDFAERMLAQERATSALPPGGMNAAG